MSEKARGKQRAQEPEEFTPPSMEDSASSTSLPIPSSFPHFVTEDKKLAIIREWQERMDYEQLTRHACAVCAHATARRDIVYVEPEEVDFALLRNPALPHETLPTTYNFNAYDQAILCPEGLHDKQEKGVVEMCEPCYASVVGKRKQPLDSLANFLYYAQDELPEPVKVAFSKASMFDQMLISRARVTRITQLYAKNKKSPLYGTRLSESQRYSQGNVAILPQDSLHLRALSLICTLCLHYFIIILFYLPFSIISARAINCNGLGRHMHPGAIRVGRL